MSRDRSAAWRRVAHGIVDGGTRLGVHRSWPAVRGARLLGIASGLWALTGSGLAPYTAPRHVVATDRLREHLGPRRLAGRSRPGAISAGRTRLPSRSRAPGVGGASAPSRPGTARPSATASSRSLPSWPMAFPIGKSLRRCSCRREPSTSTSSTSWTSSPSVPARRSPRGTRAGHSGPTRPRVRSPVLVREPRLITSDGQLFIRGGDVDALAAGDASAARPSGPRLRRRRRQDGCRRIVVSARLMARRRARPSAGFASHRRDKPSAPRSRWTSRRRSLLDKQDLVLNTSAGRVNPTRQHPVRSLKGSHQS